MFDWVDAGPGTAVGDLYEDRFRIIVAAEDAGFSAYHMAEHHSTPLGVAPSPSVFLAALSQRTTRIKLIPSVYLLPMYSPFRLAEEICMLDHLARGRFEFGIGRGASKWEAMGFSVGPDVAKPMMEEAFDALLGALRTGVMDHHGEHYDYDRIQTSIRPFRPEPSRLVRARNARNGAVVSSAFDQHPCEHHGRQVRTTRRSVPRHPTRRPRPEPGQPACRRSEGWAQPTDLRRADRW
jgi:alkanesulfonate monooxygenase SsuD/methylene tetrahydromethanopterin reductase-like flavin-dependent oxidoreductase (luciferase family)